MLMEVFIMLAVEAQHLKSESEALLMSLAQKEISHRLHTDLKSQMALSLC